MTSVSVVIRTTGKPEKIRLLKMLLQSLSQQTYKNFELIIVCESNADIIRNLTSKYFNKFKVIETGFWNRCKTTNFGILIANGEYIALLDDDYILDRNWLEELLSVLKKLPENTACIASNCIPVHREAFKYRHPSIARILEALSFRPLWRKKGKWYDRHIFIGVSLGGTHVICKRQAILNVGGCDMELEEPLIGDDLSLALKLYKKKYENAVDFKVKAYHLERYVTKQINANPHYYEKVVYSEIYTLAKYVDVTKIYALSQLIYRILWSFLYVLRNKKLTIILRVIRGGIIGLIHGLLARKAFQ